MKKIVAQFSTPGMTAQQYDQAVEDLEAAGKGKPSGRLYHVVAQQAIGMLVTDVWESEEALNEFSETLIPILVKNGVTPAQPTLLPVHNIIIG
ncbi:MAG: hypothetical protein WKF70_11895 [Chitinophagaceae bacterium]